jgi:hypothetical protein
MAKGRLLALVLGLIVAPAVAWAQAPPIRLVGWADDPTLLPRAGAGVEMFRLWAEVRWDGPAAAGVGRLAKRVVGPGGESTTEPIDPDDVASGRRIAVYVPSGWVRNRRPEAVAIEVSIVEAATGRVVAGPLRGGIDAFPRPRTDTPPDDPGPFGWGRPLDGPPGAARTLTREGPDGWRFARVPGSKSVAAFFLATTEASNRQVSARLPGYDPRAGRSDEFLLDGPDQPAVGLSPAACLDYLKSLQAADADGPRYRLPTRVEWLLAARAGRESPYWWGDTPTHPDANLLGDEPALRGDSTAPVRPGAASPAFGPNPWGFLHAFGNVEEWATDPSGGFVRLGGHFRTEPSTPLPETAVADPKSVGPDLYVGLRPAFDLAAGPASDAIKRRLATDPRLAGVTIQFDPDRATATLGGTVAESGDRRRADARVATLWWVEAVENRIEAPRFAPGQLARLGGVAGPARLVTPPGRAHYEVPVAVRWADPLPVRGSEWWVNVEFPGGRESHRLLEGEPDASGRITAVVDRARIPGAIRGAEATMNVSLSLGGPATSADDPRVVSNVAPVQWKVP